MIELVIFGRDNCPHCIKAKELSNKLLDKGLIDKVDYRDLMANKILNTWTKRDISELFNVPMSSIYTIPQIGLKEGDNVVYIGGYNDLENKFRDKL